MITLLAGRSDLLGSRVEAGGTNFALWSANATAVELCLFDRGTPAREIARLPLPERTGDVWHGFAPGVKAGQRYGFRVHGRWAPHEGHRFDPTKLLVDPWARALDGGLRWNDALLGRAAGSTPVALDDARFVPRSVVVAPLAAVPNAERPRIAARDVVLYECHVGGMTRRHPAVPPSQRGRYLGLAHPSVLEHLTRIGVTTISLLPVHQHGEDRALAQRGLVNYWGYAPLAYFAPDVRFASAPGEVALHEFREMTRRLHEAGLEVLVDVVYNHTCEGDETGATVSWRGIDNASYYRLREGAKARGVDYTGCGNSLDARSPAVVRLVIESLRHWVTELGVDGFRFDLASVLGRDPEAFSSTAPLLRAIAGDPVLSHVRLVAEPWDATPDGFALGRFPAPWAEWNSLWRDAVRRFWRGDSGMVGELATRIAGSSDLFGTPGRGPRASVNFVACHDGFTLRDLLSYGQKHNEANCEAGRDGTNENHSWNHGVEGATDRADVRREREQSARALLATLAFSLGTPMLGHGDELGRTQRGNNNAYCLDDETTWLDWDRADARMIDFTARVFALRREAGFPRRAAHFSGLPARPGGRKDVCWLREDGEALCAEDWARGDLRHLAMWVRGTRSAEGDDAGEARDHVLVMNASESELRFALPKGLAGGVWRERLCSTDDEVRPLRGRVLLVPARAVVLLRWEPFR